MRNYAPAYSQAALDALISAKLARRTRAIDAIMRLCRRPQQAGDCAITDEDGRMCQMLMSDGVLLTYWADDAVCELRIIAIDWTD